MKFNLATIFITTVLLSGCITVNIGEEINNKDNKFDNQSTMEEKDDTSI